MTNDNPLSEYATKLRESDGYSGSDLEVLEAALQEKVEEIDGATEKQEELRQDMGLASSEAEEAVESPDVVRLEKRSTVQEKQDDLRSKILE